MKLELAVQYACPRRGLPHRRSIERWIGLALATDARIAEARLTVRFVGRAEGRALNRGFRAKDYATNVLTFDYLDEGRQGRSRSGESCGRMHAAPAAGIRSRAGMRVLGDIILCATVVQREAREQHKELSAHYAHLLVHGVLHLLGYDHERGREAQRMERLEARLLRSIGYPDPYE